MKGEHKVKICWTGKKHEGNYVCFIPLTIDGVGVTVDRALMNLEREASKIISALVRSRIKCNFTKSMVHEAVKESSWWNKEASTHKKEDKCRK